MSEPTVIARCDCGKVFRVAGKHAGKRIACPDCGDPITLPPLKRSRPVRRSRPAEELPDRPAPKPTRRASKKRPASRKSKKSKSGWSTGKIVLAVIGGGSLLMLAVCGGLIYVGFGELKNATVYDSQPDFGEPENLFPLKDIPVPSFATATISREQELPNVARWHEVTVTSSSEKNAGFETRLRIVVPLGDHPAKSLPVVFVAPAGTNLLVGSQLGSSDYYDETIPYVEAGMIAVSYSLDGECDLESMTDQQLRDGYLRFRAACAGVVNARNALEYVSLKIPQADPKRMFAAGHSSAANVSLLFAAHEPRIRACIAYCPAADVESELAEMAEHPAIDLLLPKMTDFLKQSSPKTHAARYRCPIYLLHSRQDLTTHFSGTAELANAMKANGTDVTYVEVPTGDHYSSMINGIPDAIEWLKLQK